MASAAATATAAAPPRPPLPWRSSAPDIPYGQHLDNYSLRVGAARLDLYPGEATTPERSADNADL